MIAYTNYTTDARVRREAETLVQHGYSVLFLSLDEYIRPRKTEINGVTLYQIKVIKYRGKNNLVYILSYILFLLKAFVNCSFLTVRGNIDFVHIHNMPNFLVFAALLPRILGKKIVLDIHDSTPETYTGKFGALPKILYMLLILEEQVCAAFAHKVICANHVQMKPLIQRGIPAEKITVSLNVPDPAIFNSRNRLPKKKSRKHFNIVYHGTLDKTLGIDLAIRMIKLLITAIPEVTFTIYGRGKDTPELCSLVKNLELEKYVYISDAMVPLSELPKKLSMMDIGLVPNRKNIATQQMLPVKLLEYVALEIPAVVPRLDAIAYYFSENMVTFYEAENIDSMAQAIISLYNDKSKRKKQALNALKVLDTYGWATHKYELMKVYENI